MTFQVSDAKDRQFLDLLDNDLHPIESLYIKEGSWIKYFGHLNSLCIRATRAIINHTSIGEYCLCFFPKKNFSCLCKSYPIELKCYIFHNCKRFNNYWNLRRDTISYFVLFIEFNSNAFFFSEGITQQSSLCLCSSYNICFHFILFYIIFFLPFSSFILFPWCLFLYNIVTKQLSWSVYMLCIINC